MKTSIMTVLKIAVAGGIILWLIHNQSLNLHVLFSLVDRPEYFPLLIGLPLVNLCLNHYRWLLLLQAQGLKVTYWSTLPLSFIGLFFNFAIPGGVGGDVVKGYYLLRDQPERKLDATATVLLDRILGVFSMLILSALSLSLNPSMIASSPEMRALATMIYLCVLGCALFSIFVFTNYLDHLGFSFENLPHWRPFDLVRKLHGTVTSFRQESVVLFKCILISWVSHLAAIGFIAVVVHLTSVEPLPWHTYFFVVPLGFIAMALPIAPAGVGVGQAAFFFLFKLYTGQASQVGPNAITAFQASQLGLGLVGAIMFLRKRKSIAHTAAAMERA